MGLEIGDYLIGDDELTELLEVAGDDYDMYDVGAARRVGKMQAAASKIAAARKAMSSRTLTANPPTEVRQYPLGFDSGAAGVAAATNVLITSRPQQIFRPERLILSSASAPAFLVNDILVGNRSQLVAAGALPGDAFRPDAFGVRLKMDVARVSQDITLSVTNLTAATQRFNAALIGDCLQ